MSNLETYLKKHQTPGLPLVDKVLATKFFDHFIYQAWKVVEPKQQLLWGWHIDAIIEHLNAVRDGHIRRLLINIPPRHMKSLNVAVFFPTWIWTSEPWFKFLFASYAKELSTRDSLKRRRIIQSNWYQQSWGDKVILAGDQNAKTRFENTETGYCIATSIEGIGTGEGGDGIIVDDPHNVKEAESEAKREAVLLWWDEVMSSRLNSPETGWKIIIMQRCHERDLSGHVLESSGYEHLCLPARYEGENRSKTSLHFVDPRTKADEVLWERRYPDHLLKELEFEMSLRGQYAVAGQLQQRPSPRGGGMFKVDKFVIVERFNRNEIVHSIRYWDKAATQGGGAQTAGTLIHSLKDKTFLIEDCESGHWNSANRENRIMFIAEMDGVRVTIWIEQEPGSSGIDSVQASIKMLAGFKVFADRVTGSKETRAEPYAAQVFYGNIKLLKGEWNRSFIDEHETFPVGKFKDKVDSAAGAFTKLTAKKKSAGVW